MMGVVQYHVASLSTVISPCKHSESKKMQLVKLMSQITVLMKMSRLMVLIWMSQLKVLI
jgi:hypothetical protein